jgi:hypothetical protein
MSGPEDNDEPQPVSGRRALAGLLILATAIVLVLFLIHRLQEASRIQDCVASGRTNCAPIEAPVR